MGYAEDLREGLKEVERERCRRDLVYLSVEVLGDKDLDHEVYREMAKNFENRAAEKPLNLILIPRLCMKTTFFTENDCIRQIICNPNVRILITSAVLENAKKMLRNIKRKMESARFMELFGDLRTDTWNNDEIIVKGRTRFAKESTIEIGSITNTKTSRHYDVIKADDLVTRDNIISPESIHGVKVYYQDLFDLMDYPGGVIDVIGTRWCYGDLYGDIMANTEMLQDFNVILKKAYDGPLEDGKLNFPWKLNKKTIAYLKRQKTTFEFSAQYLNDPTPDNDATFRPEYFQQFSQEPPNCNVFMLVDPASTNHKKSDYSAIIVVGVDSDGKWYVLDIARDKLLPGALSLKILKMADQYKPIKIGIEVNGGGYLFHDMQNKMRVSGNIYQLQELRPKKINKSERIRALEPKFRSKEIYFPKEIIYTNTDNVEMDMVFAMKDELMKFPLAKHDDLSDCLSYGVEMCYGPIKDVLENRLLYEGDDPLSRYESRIRDAGETYREQEEDVEYV